MSQTMTSVGNNSFSLEIKRYYMLRNGWEYFVTELPDEDGIGEALVEGFEQEVGGFSLDEIKPHIMMVVEADKLTDLAPANGFVWGSKNEV
tara:strand:- start:560 stop:832 length:273 start_codon:yes stop_codon:yes gene_type:complete